MKHFNKPALLLVSLIGLSVISSLVPLISTASGSDIGESGAPGHERWWDSQWHYRKSITIDANDYGRRWGLPIETSIGIYDFLDLDLNSIRVIYEGSEIPSYYYRTGTPPTYTGDVLMFVTNESMADDGLMHFTVYYDKTANGGKLDPDYGEAWAQGIVESYDEADAAINAYQQSRDEFKLWYDEVFKVDDENDDGVGTLNGYTVIFDEYDGDDSLHNVEYGMPDDPASMVWEYAQDYPGALPIPTHKGDEAHYITNDGEYYWYDGRAVYRDDQGNWYFNDTADGIDGGYIAGALYFIEGQYFIAVENIDLGSGPLTFLVEVGYNPDFPVLDDLGATISTGAWVIASGGYIPGYGWVIDYPEALITIGTVTPYYRFRYNPTEILLFEDSTGHWHAKYKFVEPIPGGGSATYSRMYRIEECVLHPGTPFEELIPGDWQIKYYPDSSNPDLYEVIAEYDASLNALFYDGNLIYYDEISDMWLWEAADGSIGMLFEIAKVATYIDPEGIMYSIYSDDAGGWIYEVDGVITGYIYKDAIAGNYMIHYLPTSISAVTVGESFYVDGAEIVYDGVTDMRWEYAATGDPVPELVGALHVATYDNELIYAKVVSEDNPFTIAVDPQDVTRWFYLETGVMMGEMCIFHDADGNDIYVVIEGVDTRAMYWDNGVLYMWSGAEWLAYGPFDYGGQSIYLSSAFNGMCPAGLGIGDAYTNGVPDFGPIKSVLSGSAVIDTSPTTSFVETATLTTWRNVPDYKVDFSAAEPDFLSLMGSALFNLDGAIQFDSNTLTRHNIMAYVDTLLGNLKLLAGIAGVLGVTILDFVVDTADWTANDWLGFMNSADRYMIITEVAPIDVDSLDFATDPRVEDKTGVYVTGNTYDELLSIPIEVSTRYVGVFDIMTATGFGISINALTPITDYIVEIWQETIGTDISYYVNILVNHDLVNMPNNFQLNLVYLDSSVDPNTAMLDSIPEADGGLQEVIITTGVENPAISISIGIIILPIKAEVGDPVNVTVGIKGETIGAIKFRVDNNPTEFDWNVRYDFYIINVPVEHWGQRVSTITAYPTIGTHTITVIVYDTSQNPDEHPVPAAVKSATIDIKPRASDIFAWIAALISTLFGIIGIAVIKNKKIGRAKGADCIGGECNI